MKLERRWLEELVFSGDAPRRFTQDSPILPDVWLEYGSNGSLTHAQDLLFTPYRQTTPAALACSILSVVGESAPEKPARRAPARTGRRRRAPSPPRTHLHEIASNQSVVAARLSFDEMIRTASALGSWPTFTNSRRLLGFAAELATPKGRAQVAAELRELSERNQSQLRLLAPPEPTRSQARSRGRPAGRGGDGSRLPPTLLWFMRVVGAVRLALAAPEPRRPGAGLDLFRKLAWSFDRQVAEFAAVAAGVARNEGQVFLVGRNRAAAPAMDRSVVTVKADAARRLFQLGCDKLTWAILDSGVDATHPAFRRRGAAGTLLPVAAGKEAADSRVVATYDFTRVRSLLNPSDAERDETLRRLRARVAAGARLEDPSERREHDVLVQSLAEGDDGSAAKQLRSMLRKGRMLDWSLLEDLVRVPHDAAYERPGHDHGTHVAGVLAADWQAKDYPAEDPRRPPPGDLVGMCPDIRLIDLRAFDANGTSDEFAVMAALQFIRWLNGRSEQPAIHGVNLSLSIHHDVTNFACGRTPVCEECSRLVNSGVVVVAAAGNAGRAEFTLASGESSEGYRSISIADPGNTDEVITVGATHRHQPHTYGVSYFSSRGPTGDGRTKPDLVAPGERITSTVPGGGAATKDGTSMAAPHVSGAAALLLARHRELVGRPLRVKEIICASATDLRRERYFQGAGLVDVLRALQAV